MIPFWSFYDKAFYKSYIYSEGLSYNTSPKGYGGVVILEDIISRPFNYIQQNDYIKMLIWSVWEDDGRGGGYPPSDRF
jgi:hypothetical protein